ncbi:MAG TPA: VWA domain-containing protein [Flavipsychrobacter sp.]|nr:VWA domain-containing protein [Flavipsychrobacter sp.]
MTRNYRGVSVFNVGLRIARLHMSLRNLIAQVFLLSLPFIAFAQEKKKEYKKYRVLILLDGSSSMIEKWNDHDSRFKTAGNIIMRLMDSVYRANPDVEFALRVYGHQHGVPEKNCFDTKREVNFSKDNYTQMLLRLESLDPFGVSPIAYSLKTAAEEDFNDSYNYAYSLVLVTDGGESCNGNICDVVKNLLDRKIQFKPYIISLVDYAPLKDQYACLGNYLQAANPGELDKAVGTIAENYKRVLNVPVLKLKPVDTPVKKAEVAVLVPPPVIVKTEPVAPKPQPEIKKEAIAFLKRRSQFQVWPLNNIRPTLARQRKIPAINIPEKEIEPVVIKKDELVLLPTSAKLRSFGLFWSTPTLKKRIIARIPIPPKEAEPVVGSANTVIKPVALRQIVRKAEIKEASFTTKTEPSQQTTLQIFFTDGKGKFYHTSPAVRVVDSKTGAEVKKFYRLVDANGNPEPQTLAAGNYTLLVGKSENFVAKQVTVSANNNNKVTMVAVSGTLSFKYTYDQKRPMSEFTALVKKNFEPGPVITQPCETKKVYEPGNYHIEINTVPISRRNLDIDFGIDFIIEIEEPGYVSFTNTDNLGKVSLYYQNGDMFSKFEVVEIKGNPALQKVKLQPGPYQARFKENGVFQSTMEKIVQFQVKSNETTEVQLK